MKKLYDKKYEIFSIIILIVLFLLMCYDAASKSFWVDELDWSVAFLNRNNFFEMIKSLVPVGYSLPLFFIIFYPIYKIAPFGETWLLIPNFILVILGILIIKKIGEKIKGKDLGFASLCAAATSYVLIVQVGFEFRPYALLFLLSAWTLYRFIELLEENNLKNKILYTLSLILLAYTHWFGCLIIVFYFLVDLFRFFKKKIKFSFIVPYIILGIAFLPWFIPFLLYKEIDIFTYYWNGPPQWSAAIVTIEYLLSNNRLCILLFAIGTLYFIINLLLKKYKQKESKKELAYTFLCFGAIIWVIGTIFIYSKLINPAGSLYVLRYFTILLPHIFIIMAIPLSELLHLVVKINGRKINAEINNIPMNKDIAFLIVIIIICLIGSKNYMNVHYNPKVIHEPYREVSNKVAAQKDIYTDKSAFLLSCGSGSLFYYFEKQGYEIPENVYIGPNIQRVYYEKDIRIYQKATLEELLQYETLYVANIHTPFDDSIIKYIDENFTLVERDDSLNLSVYKNSSLEDQ